MPYNIDGAWHMFSSAPAFAADKNDFTESDTARFQKHILRIRRACKAGTATYEYKRIANI